MYFFSIIILTCLILPTLNMPTQVLVDYDKEAKEDSYGDSYRSDSGDYLQNQQKPLLKQENEKADDRNDELERASPERDYLENNDEDQAENANPSLSDMRLTNNKRTAECNKQSVLLFENHEKPSIIQKSEYNENDDSGQQLQYSNLPAINNVERNAGFKRFIKKEDSISRDRREINNSDANEIISAGDTGSTQKLDFDVKEDEETAIKRHIKKLSKQELDELMNSLSDDKRALLKNIIDNSQEEAETVNKREITKKAGTNEENSLVGNEQSDTSKIQEGSADIEAESSASNTEKSENVKKLESETICSKSTETVTSSEKPDTANVLDSMEDAKLKKSDGNTEIKIQDNSNAQESSKNEKKREINLNVSNGNAEALNANSDELFYSVNDDISQLWNEESKLYSNNKIDQREICDSKSESFKSLEESFPNSNDEIRSRRGSIMVPLVRVKRKDRNKVMQRRDTNDISDLRVPYFSNAIEDNEYDTDEGSEFEGDGIFSKRSNFDKSDEIDHNDEDILTKEKSNNFKVGNHNSQEKGNNLESNMLSLGSDSDAILSGIEGIDDNMMYNSVSRNRRNLGKFSNLNEENDIEYHKPKNIPEVPGNEYNEISERNNNAPRYQENDAFGSLPRNYEEDLGRFKRIRRLKPLCNVENSLPHKQ